jgi:hypothetical protein
MPQMGFETTIPVFERAKAVTVLDGAAMVIYIGFRFFKMDQNFSFSYNNVTFQSQNIFFTYKSLSLNRARAAE